MKFTQFLKSLPLDSLMEMLTVGTQNVLESTKDHNAYDMTLVYQQVLDKIQTQLIVKWSELPMK